MGRQKRINIVLLLALQISTHCIPSPHCFTTTRSERVESTDARMRYSSAEGLAKIFPFTEQISHQILTILVLPTPLDCIELAQRNDLRSMRNVCNVDQRYRVFFVPTGKFLLYLRIYRNTLKSIGIPGIYRNTW